MSSQSLLGYLTILPTGCPGSNRYPCSPMVHPENHPQYVNTSICLFPSEENSPVVFTFTCMWEIFRKMAHFTPTCRHRVVLAYNLYLYPWDILSFIFSSFVINYYSIVSNYIYQAFGCLVRCLSRVVPSEMIYSVTQREKNKATLMLKELLINSAYGLCV